MGSVPIVNLPNLYINNLQVTVAGNTDLQVAAGQCRDSTDSYDIVINDPLDINLLATGANGLDQGTIAANAWYYIYAITDPTANYAPAAVASLSATGPLMPYGYGASRLIGVAQTQASVLELLYVSGTSNERRYYWDNVVDCGTGTSLVLANLNISSAVPPIDKTPVIINPTLNATAVAGATVGFAYPGSSSTALAQMSASVVGLDTLDQLEVIAGVVGGNSTIAYVLSATGSVDVTVTGFTLYL